MRVLASTIGAFLISVSYPALAPDRHAGLAQEAEFRYGQPTPPDAQEADRHRDEPLQGEPERLLAELPDQPLDMQPAAERLLAELPDRPIAQAQMQPTAERLLAELPDRPLAQAKMQPAAERLLAELPDRPLAQADTRQEQPVAMPRDPEWTTLNDPAMGTAMDLPGAVFSTPDGHANKDTGRRFKTRDGRAKVAVWAQHNTQHDTPASYLRKTFSHPPATVDYQRIAHDFFAVSGASGNSVYYIRCNFSPTGETLHCFDLAYPAREKKAWEGIVTRMSRSLRPLGR